MPALSSDSWAVGGALRYGEGIDERVGDGGALVVVDLGSVVGIWSRGGGEGLFPRR